MHNHAVEPVRSQPGDPLWASIPALRTHRYCGRCDSPTAQKDGEWATCAPAAGDAEGRAGGARG